MEGIEYIEPTDLYNLINQGFSHPLLSDPKYLLLLDLRQPHEYAENHIVTAKLIPKDEENRPQLPQHLELDTKQHIVVYGLSSTALADRDSPTVAFASLLWHRGSKYPVRILRGGYEKFSALYPFLRTQVTAYTHREMDNFFLYPLEIIPRFLYIGTWEQAQDSAVHKHLKVKAHLSVSLQRDSIFPDKHNFKAHHKVVPSLLWIRIQDEEDENAFAHFQSACDFIGAHNNGDGQSILIWSDLGLSRCVTFVLAYLMFARQLTLQDAWNHVMRCKPNLRPLRSFVKQLSIWETHLKGETMTDIRDPHY